MSHAGFLERVFASWNGRAFRARGLNENGHTHNKSNPSVAYANGTTTAMAKKVTGTTLVVELVAVGEGSSSQQSPEWWWHT